MVRGRDGGKSANDTNAPPTNKKKAKPFVSKGFGPIYDGAEGETRTRTTVGYYPLKIACLPIPPLRQNLRLFFFTLCFPFACGSCSFFLFFLNRLAHFLGSSGLWRNGLSGLNCHILGGSGLLGRTWRCLGNRGFRRGQRHVRSTARLGQRLSGSFYGVSLRFLRIKIFHHGACAFM